MKNGSEEKKKMSQDGGALSASPQLDLEAHARELGVGYLAEAPKSDKETLSLIPEDVAKKHGLAVFERSGNAAKVVMGDPQSVEALNVLRFIAENKKVEFEVYISSEEVLEELLEQYTGGAEKAIAEAMQSLKDDGIGEDMFAGAGGEKHGGKKEDVMQDAPVTKLLSVIIHHAIEGKASDIHIEPVEKSYRVRFRVDGILHSSLAVPKEVGRAVVSRIKILSNLKIDEKRKPQDGRFRVAEGARAIDFRVSTLPVVDGEKVVLRLLDKDNKPLDVEGMGLIGRNKDILLRHIRDPYGIILITGPTGSGKSTTLYAFLQILNQEERNIITLEDPVEYSLEGVNQSQIRPEIGYTFASGLRSILRQDPNVIMVGEIRDNETAELSIHAALTGHLVLSTLHTNSSIGAIPRLIDMSIEPFLLSSALQVVAAQRLVRRICPKCKEQAHVPAAVEKIVEKELERISPEEIKAQGVNLEKGLKFYQGKGCDACNGTGYKGRIAIFEALEVDSEIKEIISDKNGGESEVKKYAEEHGMVTIKQDGILKVLAGHTTFAEVERVTEGSLSVGGDLDDDKG